MIGHHRDALGSEGWHLARTATPLGTPPRGGPTPGAPSSMRRPLWIAVALACLFTLASCKGSSAPKEHEKLAFHAQVYLGASMDQVVSFCGGSICELKTPLFSEIEYVSDASAKVEGYILRSARQEEPNVKASQETFTKARETLQGAMGEGESFLKSGDPTYWPKRGKDERIATLTTDNDLRVVLAVGPVGPDSAKIPKSGHAYDKDKVAEFWKKITTLPELELAPVNQ